MNHEIIESIAHIARQRNLSTDFIVGALKEAIVRALGHRYPGREIDVRIDSKRGELTILIEKDVVQEVKNPDIEISVEEARRAVPDIKPGERTKVVLPLDTLGRGIINKIQNFFQQKIREEERVRIYKDFQRRRGELIKGRVYRIDKTGVYLQIGADGVIPPNEQIPGERYRLGHDIYAIVLDVDKTPKGKPRVLLSRTHPDFIRRLMEKEIPDVADGTVEVRAVVREPGKRAKVAVRSRAPNVDPIGACIGVRGAIIRPIVQELGNENIDVVRWFPDNIRMAASAMSPIIPMMVYEDDENIYVVVKDDEVADAKGKDGLNVKLASRLVDKPIQIVPLSEYKPPENLLTVLELDINDDIKERLRREGYFFFTEVPPLAELMERTKLDERRALVLLKKIEEGIERKLIES